MIGRPQSPLPLSSAGVRCSEMILHVVALAAALYLLRSSCAWLSPISAHATPALLFAEAAVVRDARSEMHMFDPADSFPSQACRQSRQVQERRDRDEADSKAAREAAEAEIHPFETAASTIADAARSVKRRWDQFTQLGWQPARLFGNRQEPERAEAWAAACAAAAKIGPHNRLPASIQQMRSEHRLRHLKSPTPVLSARFGFGSGMGILIAAAVVIGAICLCAALMGQKRRAAREAEIAEQQRRANVMMQPPPPTSYATAEHQLPPPPYDSRSYPPPPPPGYDTRGGYAGAYPQQGPYGPSGYPPSGYPPPGYPAQSYGQPYGYPPQVGAYPAQTAMGAPQSRSSSLGGLGGMAASGLGGFGLGTLMGHGLGSMFGGHHGGGGGYGWGSRDPEYVDGNGGGGGGEFAAEEGPPMEEVDLGGGDDGGTFNAES